MRKYLIIGFVLFLPLFCVSAENLVFNPGFDETPWDTGWTVDTSFYSDKYYSQYTKGDTYAQGDTSKYVSQPRSCKLFAWDTRGGGQHGSGVVTSISQTFHPVTACTAKLYSQTYVDGSDGSMGVTFLRNSGSWSNTISYNSTDSTWIEWSHIFSPSDTIKGITISTGGYGFIAGATIYVTAWIDDVYISGTEVEIEEKSNIKYQNAKIEVKPNPFVCKTRIQYTVDSGQEKSTSIQIYGVTGKLMEETNSNVVGKNLKAGIYFIKVEGYEPMKIVKLGRLR